MRGSREIGFTVLSMSISLIAVFIPILLMGGILGRIFREFAVTLSVAVAISLVVSLTTTPEMCAKFLKPQDKSRTAHLDLSRQRERLRPPAQRVRAQPPLGPAAPATYSRVTLGTVCLAVYLYIIVPKGFFRSKTPAGSTGMPALPRTCRFSRCAEADRVHRHC